jgi:hypothetical protein
MRRVSNLVHIDESVNKEKQTFLKLHETGHKEIPHQKGLYRWIQDCRKHLAPEIAELFEREANTFATIVLFQDDGFAKIATADSSAAKCLSGPRRNSAGPSMPVFASTRPERRRRWSSEEKGGIVAEVMLAGATVTEIAQRHGISRGLLYTWRREAGHRRASEGVASSLRISCRW